MLPSIHDSTFINDIVSLKKKKKVQSCCPLFSVEVTYHIIVHIFLKIT